MELITGVVLFGVVASVGEMLYNVIKNRNVE